MASIPARGAVDRIEVVCNPIFSCSTRLSLLTKALAVKSESRTKQVNYRGILV
jgi:hypothetical protein